MRGKEWIKKRASKLDAQKDDYYLTSHNKTVNRINQQGNSILRSIELNLE